MAVTIVATLKGASSNSYQTLAAAESLADARSDIGAWTSATDDTKNRALVTATNRLEQEDYYGTPTDQSQALKWPRSGLSDDDGRSYDQDTIPKPVLEAHFEIALAIVKGELELKDTGLEGFQNVKVGSLDVTPIHGKEAGALPRQAIRWLRGLRIGSSGITVKAVRA